MINVSDKNPSEIDFLSNYQKQNESVYLQKIPVKK